MRSLARGVVCLCATLVAFVAGAATAPPRLHGVASIGDVWMASLSPGGNPQRWCRVGDRAGEFVVAAIDLESVTLTGADGMPLIVRLPEPKVANVNAPPTDPQEWKRWVNSRGNPMLEKPAPFPVTPRHWPVLAAERRRAIEEWYRLHGWSVDVSVDSNGDPAVEFAPLHGEARQAILAEKQQVFLRSLSPEQRTLHTAARRPGAPADLAAFAIRALSDSLDANQFATFQEMSDFSTPVPAKVDHAPWRQ